MSDQQPDTANRTVDGGFWLVEFFKVEDATGSLTDQERQADRAIRERPELVGRVIVARLMALA